MDKLWVRLSFAFGVVTLISVLIVGFIANSRLSTDFQRYFVENQVLESGLLDALGQYYGAHSGWAGADSVFAEGASLPGAVGGATGQGGQGQGTGMGMGNGGAGGRGMMQGMRWGAGGLTLADADRRVVYSTAGGQTGGVLAQDDAGSTTFPVTWQGTTAGYLRVTTPSHMNMTASAQLFLSQVNSGLVQAALIAGVIGLALGLLVAWAISTPLNSLALAARKLARGELHHRVTVPSRATASQEVTGLAVAFNDMADSLERAEQLRRNMAADIAHDLRTPLSVVQGNLQAILDGVYPLERAEIATIHEQTLVLGRLIEDLRELAQVEAGKLNLQLQLLDLMTVVEPVMGMYREVASARGVELVLTVSPDLPEVVADPDRIKQVLHNLLDNALRYTPSGGKITVRLDTSTGPDGQPNALAVSVVDTGQGIAPEDLPQVFDRFWRADKSRSRLQGDAGGYGGSGLGLAISKQLVEAQGGQIGAESVPGYGSRFWFSLPAYQPAASAVRDAYHS